MQRYSRSELSLGGCYCSNFFCVSIQTQFASLEYVGTQMGWEREFQHFLTWSSTHRQGISPRGENIRSLVSGRSNLTKVGHGFPRTLAGPFLVSMVMHCIPSPPAFILNAAAAFCLKVYSTSRPVLQFCNASVPHQISEQFRL